MSGLVPGLSGGVGSDLDLAAEIAEAANERRFVEAAAAFRRSAAGSVRDTFRVDAERMARRMDARAQGDHAVAVARTGDTRGAIAILEAIDRGALRSDERRWVEETLAKLRRSR